MKPKKRKKTQKFNFEVFKVSGSFIYLYLPHTKPIDMTTFQDVKHLSLYSSLEGDQLEERLPLEITNLPHFTWILQLSHLDKDKVWDLWETALMSNSWPRLELSLKTCAYLGLDELACIFIRKAIWKKEPSESGLHFRL